MKGNSWQLDYNRIYLKTDWINY